MKKVGILAPLTSSGVRRMLDTLGEVLGIRFVERTFGDDAGIDAWFFQEADLTDLPTIVLCNRPCYTVISRNHLVPCGESSTIEFSRHSVLPPVICGRQIQTHEAVGLKTLPPWIQNGTKLASKGGAPIWEILETDGLPHHFVSASIPELKIGEQLFQYFYGEQFLSILPLYIFLRALIDDQRWEPPPLQACFMFDDPNLHWRTYGFIDFAKMARHAQIHNYHVSFATIPLDAWFVHSPTAHIFKQHHQHISLLIHGNDHVAQELGRDYSEEERCSLLRQALKRIEKLEQRSDVEVSRVMVPPHGALIEKFLETMSLLGLEAACVSRWSLRHYNPEAAWIGTFGMKPSDVIAGLTVIPRIRMSRTCHNNILVAALLYQPIIPIAHHRDVSEGLNLLGDLSTFINSLGSVKWADMKRISRSNFSRRYDGNILRLRMFSKRIEILMPEGIIKIFVERAWLKGTEYEPLAWRVMGEKLEWTLLRPDETIPALPGEKIEIVSKPVTLLPTGENAVRKFRIWPTVRRQLTETRDRVAPALRRFSIRPEPKC